MEITQGDAYNINISLKDKDGNPITDDVVLSAEVSIGSLKKYYPDVVTFADGKFVMPITQEETFKMSGILSFKIRPTFINGDTVTAKIGTVEVNVYDEDEPN